VRSTISRYVAEPELGWLAAGVAGVALLGAAFSAAGDTPDPHDPAGEMAAYFAAHRADVLAAGPAGWVGTGLVLVFALHVVSRGIGGGAARSVGVLATAGVGLYLGGLLLALSTLAWASGSAAGGPADPAAAEAVRLLFVTTICASPVAGGSLALLLGVVALAGRTGPWATTWYRLLSGAGGLVAGLAVLGHAEAGFFYADVQQQWVLNILVLWVVVTGVTGWARSARAVGSSVSGNSTPGAPALR
jgi:hypothetical protein